jgi:hypothetical protein
MSRRATSRGLQQSMGVYRKAVGLGLLSRRTCRIISLRRVISSGFWELRTRSTFWPHSSF